ncbi:hypothetical protein BS78_03G178000 [Paspalum vaginatum]|nr:hypothetical protein BS78_03G178000 [Paspalum vaginatum]
MVSCRLRRPKHNRDSFSCPSCNYSTPAGRGASSFTAVGAPGGCQGRRCFELHDRASSFKAAGLAAAVRAGGSIGGARDDSQGTAGGASSLTASVGPRALSVTAARLVAASQGRPWKRLELSIGVRD